MRIIQLLPTITYGDAVSNDALAIREIVQEMGYTTDIYAESIDERLKNLDLAQYYTKMPKLTAEDVLIYHFSTGSALMKNILSHVPSRNIMIYHNVTPFEFFAPYNIDLATISREGLRDLVEIKDLFEYCLADSEYNKQDLLNAGYSCPVDVLPILIRFSDYDKRQNHEIIDTYKGDGWTNILFVGRVAPNKKHEDIIKAFYYYKKHINKNSRLFLVGSYDDTETYYLRLQSYVKALGLDDVIFTGHVPFDQILAYYKLADVFVCLSEHEGFCIPLLEAMKFNVPIIAYDSTAISGTLGGAGILSDDKNPVLIAKLVDKVITDDIFRQNIIENEQARLEHFSHINISRQFEQLLQNFLQKNIAINKDKTNNSNVLINNQQQYLLALKKEIKPTEDEEILIPFEKMPIPPMKKERMSLKKVIKKKILKPCYLFVSSLNPQLADKIKDNIKLVLGKGNPIQQYDYNLQVVESTSDHIPSVLVDLTQTTMTDAKTGIQRVVNNIDYELRNLQDNIINVRDRDEQLLTSRRYDANRLHQKFDNKEYTISPVNDDKLLLLDSSWDRSEDFASIIGRMQEINGKAYAVIYDLFPVQYPDLFDSLQFISVFKQWHNMILTHCDGILCISRTTADIVAEYFTKKKFKRRKQLELYYFHMGSDIKNNSESDVRKEIKDFVSNMETFLMVGTIEPRKGHNIVIDAFNKLIEENHPCQLLMIGKDGWKNDEFKEKLFNSSALKYIKWVSNATDAELNWAYQNSSALISASQDEGFGLPLIEAAHFGLPILCSDIPIFHEVAGENATYFKKMDANSLKDAIVAWLKQTNHPDSRKIELYTWKDSAQEILDILNGKVEPYKLLGKRSEDQA